MCVCLCMYPKLFQHALKFLLSMFFLFARIFSFAHAHSHSQRFMHNNENLCADQIRKPKRAEEGVCTKDSENEEIGTEWNEPSLALTCLLRFWEMLMKASYFAITYFVS